MSRKRSHRRKSLELARARATTIDSVDDSRASVHALTGDLRDIFDAVTCGTAIASLAPLPPEVFDDAADALLSLPEKLANELGDDFSTDDTAVWDDVDDDELDEAIADEIGSLGAMLGGVALTTRILARGLLARVLGQGERPPVGLYYIPEPAAAQRAAAGEAVDDLARALLPSNLPDEIRPSRSSRPARSEPCGPDARTRCASTRNRSRTARGGSSPADSSRSTTRHICGRRGRSSIESGDSELPAAAIASMDGAHGALPPALALEAFISSFVFDLPVPHEEKPVRSRAEAREILAEIEAVLEEAEDEDGLHIRPDAKFERLVAALAAQGAAGREKARRRRGKKAARHR